MPPNQAVPLPPIASIWGMGPHMRALCDLIGRNAAGAPREVTRLVATSGVGFVILSRSAERGGTEPEAQAAGRARGQ